MNRDFICSVDKEEIKLGNYKAFCLSLKICVVCKNDTENIECEVFDLKREIGPWPYFCYCCEDCKECLMSMSFQNSFRRWFLLV